jgi:hypothetical protein
MDRNKNKQLQIRNSTADFLIFTRQNGEDGIAVRVEDENVWLRSEAMAELFQKSRTTIVEHLENIFETGELDKKSVCRKFRQTAEDGVENLYSLVREISRSKHVSILKKCKDNLEREFYIRSTRKYLIKQDITNKNNRICQPIQTKKD